MRTDVLGKAVRAQGGAVVKPYQVKAMILAARRAYMKVEGGRLKVGQRNDSTVQPPTSNLQPQSFDAWRRATLHDVVGAAAPSSFRAVTQRDYVAVMNYFSELAGDDKFKVQSSRFKVQNTLNLEPETLNSPKAADERRRALWALNLEEGRLEDYFGGREGARRYADSLFWKIHQTDRLTATARQVWAVIFTLRNRAKRRSQGDRPTDGSAGRTRTGLGARGASGVPLSPPDGSKRFPVFSRAL